MVGERLGCRVEGANVIIEAGSGGRVQLAATSLFEQFLLKQHKLYTGSEMQYKSNALTTTDATVTKCIEIAIPSGYSIHGIALIGGKQNDQSDAAHALFVFSATNAAGTTAVKGTSTITIVESDAATNFTIAADDTNDDVELRVTGIAAETWLWVGHCMYFFINTAA